jgi:hypothetical protein
MGEILSDKMATMQSAGNLEFGFLIPFARRAQGGGVL